MAKALVLSEEALATPVQQPRAAQPLKTEQAVVTPLKSPKAKKVPQKPLQIRIPVDDAKAIKRAALDADQTVSEFMLACYHARMKK